MNEEQLMQKLMVSKAIMNKSDNLKRGELSNQPQSMVQDFDIPQARYNIPQEFMQEQTQQPYGLFHLVLPSMHLDVVIHQIQPLLFHLYIQRHLISVTILLTWLRR